MYISLYLSNNKENQRKKKLGQGILAVKHHHHFINIYHLISVFVFVFTIGGLKERRKKKGEKAERGDIPSTQLCHKGEGKSRTHTKKGI